MTIQRGEVYSKVDPPDLISRGYFLNWVNPHRKICLIWREYALILKDHDVTSTYDVIGSRDPIKGVTDPEYFQIGSGRLRVKSVVKSSGRPFIGDLNSIDEGKWIEWEEDIMEA